MRSLSKVQKLIVVGLVAGACAVGIWILYSMDNVASDGDLYRMETIVEQESGAEQNIKCKDGLKNCKAEKPLCPPKVKTVCDPDPIYCHFSDCMDRPNCNPNQTGRSATVGWPVAVKVPTEIPVSKFCQKQECLIQKVPGVNFLYWWSGYPRQYLMDGSGLEGVCKPVENCVYDEVCTGGAHVCTRTIPAVYGNVSDARYSVFYVDDDGFWHDDDSPNYDGSPTTFQLSCDQFECDSSDVSKVTGCLIHCTVPGLADLGGIQLNECRTTREAGNPQGRTTCYWPRYEGGFRSACIHTCTAEQLAVRQASGFNAMENDCTIRCMKVNIKVPDDNCKAETAGAPEGINCKNDTKAGELAHCGQTRWIGFEGGEDYESRTNDLTVTECPSFDGHTLRCETSWPVDTVDNNGYAATTACSYTDPNAPSMPNGRTPVSYRIGGSIRCPRLPHKNAPFNMQNCQVYSQKNTCTVCHAESSTPSEETRYKCCWKEETPGDC